MEVMNKTVVLRVPASFRAGGGRWCLTNFSNFRIELCPPLGFCSHIYLSTYLNIYISTHYLQFQAWAAWFCLSWSSPSAPACLRGATSRARLTRSRSTRKCESGLSLDLFVESVFSKYCGKRFVDTSIRLPIAARTSCHQMWRFSLCCFAFSR